MVAEPDGQIGSGGGGGHGEVGGEDRRGLVIGDGRDAAAGVHGAGAAGSAAPVGRRGKTAAAAAVARGFTIKEAECTGRGRRTSIDRSIDDVHAEVGREGEKWLCKR